MQNRQQNQQNQQNPQNPLSSLKKSLADFGLNPTEWQLCPLRKSNKIFITHTKDREFRFLGELNVKSKDLTWKKIVLFQI